MSGDLAAFIAARLDEDEAAVETIRQGGFPAPTWTTEPSRSGQWAVLREIDDPTPVGYVSQGRREHEHIARHDPARVLREVEAKRAILADLTNRAGRVQIGLDQIWYSKILRLLAAVYSDHPGYRAEWKP